MYKFKAELKKQLLGVNKLIDLAVQIEKSIVQVSNILNGKTNTTKATAYILVKLSDPEAEILDYFERV